MNPLVEAIAVGLTLVLLVPTFIVWVVVIIVIDKVKHGIVRRNNAAKKDL